MNNLKTILKIKDLSKSFHQGKREVRALGGVNLTVAEGTSLAVMGASGSGKSTLLHLMAGLTRPDSGSILLNGQDLNQLSDGSLTRFRRDNIGLVFQALNLVPALTAEENVLLPLLSAGKTINSKRLDELLDYLGLADRRTHRPDALSGGEQQRVAIARALITEPSVVLADEPTGSLDSHNSQAICELLAKIASEQNRTIITVTHEPSVARFSDQVLVLRDGLSISQFASNAFADASALGAHCLGLTAGEATCS